MPVTRVELLDHIETSFDSAPVSRGDLLQAAETSGARTEVLAVLQRLPENKYSGPRDLWSELSDIPISV